MIENFKDIISQLKELSAVVNSFKSEAVQIRLIELVFSAQQVGDGEGDEGDGGGDGKGATPQASRGKKRRKRVSARSNEGSVPTPNAAKAPAKSAPKTAARSGRPGGKVMLESLISAGFFKTPKTLGKIVEHCDVNKALQYKQSDFSGPLGRAVRDGVLKRQKNSEKQYEYTAS